MLQNSDDLYVSVQPRFDPAVILFPSVIASAFTSDEKLIETVVQVMPVFLAGMTIFGLQRACQNMFVALGAGQGFYLYCITS